jgi:HAE1 family hydrophobic/amphiphilic exporter-1/multidrug efflux pump
MDNIVSIEEQIKPPVYHNKFMAATVSAGLAPGKSNMTEEGGKIKNT